jgi:hypothetical protein
VPNANNTAGVRPLRSFKEAKEFYDSVKPIRGTDKRPLGIRRHHRMADICMPNENTIELRYHDRSLTVWHREDNTFEVHMNGYLNAYVVDNLHGYLPQGRFKWDKGRMFVTNVDIAGRSYQLEFDRPLKFRDVNGEGKQYIALNPVIEHNTRVKRKVMYDTMKRYMPFLDWLTVVSSANGYFAGTELKAAYDRFRRELNLPTEEEVHQRLVKGNHEYGSKLWTERNHLSYLPFRGSRDYGKYNFFYNEGCELLDELVISGDGEDWVYAMHIIACRAGVRQRNEANYALPVVNAIDYLKNLTCFLYRDTVFERVEVGIGEIPSETNSNFFNGEIFFKECIK